MKQTLLASAAILGSQFAAAEAAPELAPIFSDSMVVQRGEPIPVWGTATPGAEVTVSLGEAASGTTTAGEDGRFRVDLSPQSASGPFELTVAQGRDRVTLEDVMVGDVLLCSGQSNMEFPVSRALNAGREVGAANDPLIRHFTVPKAYLPEPTMEMSADASWQKATPETAGHFSAVCYFTARDLKPHLPAGLAIGLINSSWGGSQIEAWLPKAKLEKLGGNEADLALLAEYGESPHAASLKIGGKFDTWWNGAMPEGPVPYAPGADEVAWKDAPEGLGSYTDWASENLAGKTGLIWYRGTATLSQAQAEKAETLRLGPADDVDYTWINGTFVGTTFGWGDPRSYDIPEGVLTEGENVIISGVYNSWGAGGMTGPEDVISIEMASGKKVPVSDFKFWFSPDGIGSPPRGPWESVSGLTTIGNGMIAPLGPTKYKAALWYQGESNADDRAAIYDDQLIALAESWREQSGVADLPVFIAQLPNFGGLSEGNGESNWSTLREAQRQAALADPKMELVVLIDAGDRWDIHPPNKQVVGQRMAEWIRETVYGQDIEAGGPVPMKAERRRRRTIEVSFDRIGGGLMAAGGMAGPFAVCGAEGCEPAMATLRDEKTVDVTIPSSTEAQTIRYCWGDAPVCTLFGEDGEPAVPFELTVE